MNERFGKISNGDAFLARLTRKEGRRRLAVSGIDSQFLTKQTPPQLTQHEKSFDHIAIKETGFVT